MADEDFKLRLRGATRIVRTGVSDSGFSYRSVHGWRHFGIDRTLDQCAMIDGSLWVDLEDVQEGDDGYWRGRDQRRSFYGQEAKKVNNRKQADKWREKVRLEWMDYSLRYRERHGLHSKPVGFDRWSKAMRPRWLVDQEAVLAHVNVVGAEFNFSLVRESGQKPEMMKRSA